MIGLSKNTVVLSDFSESWNKKASKTIKILKKILGLTAIDIQHVGSTSVVGIKSKPIIDIVVAVESINKLVDMIDEIEVNGFYFIQKIKDREEVLFGCGSYYQGKGDLQTHFIHFVVKDSMEWLNYINFRDYLNKNKQVREDYEDLKVSIIKNLKEDLTREKYTAAKINFIQQTLRKALVDSFLDKIVTIKMDRPIGSLHPKRKEIVYPINYGYIPNVIGGDNEELDVYLLGVDKPVLEYKAKVIAIIHRSDDVEDKLVAAPIGMTYSKAEIEKAVNFQEKYYTISVEV